MKVNILRHRLDTGKGYSAYEIMQALVSATGLCSPHNATIIVPAPFGANYILTLF